MTSKKKTKKLLEHLLNEEKSKIGAKFILSTQLKEFSFIPLNRIPVSWSDIYFKTYPRFKKIKLKYLQDKKNALFKSILKRESSRDFRGGKISLEEANKIIYYSCGIRNIKKARKNFNKSRRTYPSAGAKYPLEIYPIVFRVKNIPKGIYHFNVKDNNLELLLEGDFREFIQDITAQEWTRDVALIIIITAVFKRTTRKYKERGWRYILFEAGHLAQNIFLVSTELKLKSCAIGGFLDKEIIRILDLNTKEELPIYLIAVGR